MRAARSPAPAISVSINLFFILLFIVVAGSMVAVRLSPARAAMRFVRAQHNGVTFYALRDDAFERFLDSRFDYRRSREQRLPPSFPVSVDLEGISVWGGGSNPRLVMVIPSATVETLRIAVSEIAGGFVAPVLEVDLIAVEPESIQLTPMHDAWGGAFPMSRRAAEALRRQIVEVLP